MVLLAASRRCVEEAISASPAAARGRHELTILEDELWWKDNQFRPAFNKAAAFGDAGSVATERVAAESVGRILKAACSTSWTSALCADF